MPGAPVRPPTVPASAVAERAPRASQARVLITHERILDAGVRVLARDGWEGLTCSAVARAAGASRRPILARFCDGSELGAAIWRERSGPALEAALANILSSAGLLDGEPTSVALSQALDDLSHAHSELTAGTELLVMSQFDAGIRSAVDDVASPAVIRWCTAEARRVTKARAAQRGYLISFVLGLIATVRPAPPDNVDLSVVSAPLLAAIAAGRQPSPSAIASTVHQLDPTRFDTGDPALDRLLRATVLLIGEEGYEGATVERIAREAGCSEGFIFGRYASKRDLFVDAISRHMQLRAAATHDLHQRVAAKHGWGAADAVTYRELQRPDEAQLRALALEEERLLWHDPSLAEAVADYAAFRAPFLGDGPRSLVDRRPPVSRFLEHALLVGVRLLSVLYPDAYTLRYDVMTVPLFSAWRGAAVD
jgi:AcrR family transcriptional regulator